jgi:5-methylcytosine-specific restriction endonuclease McrBC GTP-binding regulatory subunit McrB
VREDGRFRLVQFHPSYAYEDFVQGLRPDIKQTQLRYQLQKGPFLRVAEAAAQDEDAFFVLVIDEIHSGDPARIFGELLYGLEYRDEAVDLPLGGEQERRSHASGGTRWCSKWCSTLSRWCSRRKNRLALLANRPLFG